MIRIKVEKQDSGFTPAGHHRSPLAQTYPASSQLHLITLTYAYPSSPSFPENFYSILMRPTLINLLHAGTI